MRKAYSKQLRLDSPPIDQVELNFGCRDAIIPVLRSLQHVYSKPDLTETIMQLIARDINGKVSAKRGREGIELSEIVPDLYLPKLGAKQSVAQLASADDEFRAAQQNHPGVESAIGALQSGNGMKCCRDRSEIGFERYVSLAILGRNMLTLGRQVIAQEAPNSEAALTRRHAA